MTPVAMNLYLKEHERSAFGRGWEAARRCESASSCPFPKKSWQAIAWIEGFVSFVPNKNAA